MTGPNQIVGRTAPLASHGPKLTIRDVAWGDVAALGRMSKASWPTTPIMPYWLGSGSTVDRWGRFGSLAAGPVGAVDRRPRRIVIASLFQAAAASRRAAVLGSGRESFGNYLTAGAFIVNSERAPTAGTGRAVGLARLFLSPRSHRGMGVLKVR